MMLTRIRFSLCFLTLPLTAFAVDGPRGPQAVSATTGAPATLVVFSDFECPYSSKSYFILEKLQARYPAQLRVIFKHDPLDIHPNARLAHQAALAAGRQGKFRAMAELLFANQDKQDEASLLRYATRLHLDMLRFKRDLHSSEIAAQLQADQSEGDAFGVQVTPTMYLNGHLFSGFQSEATLSAAIDKEAAIKAAAPAGLLAEAPLPPAMLAELQDLPTASTGAANAPLTIVEFTDFQCPFCRQAIAPMEQFMAARGREVRWVVRTFPLDIHPDAQLAAEAALAAGAQGKFWEMHDLLFAHQQALKQADLKGYAEELHLNMTEFNQALETHRYAAQVAADRALGAKAGVEGTPTFVIDGRLVTGARSVPELNQIADAHLQPGFVPAVAALSGRPASAAVTEHAIAGPEKAPLTLTWFTDVRNSQADRQASLVKALMQRYDGRVRLLYKAFPVAFHEDSRLAAAALMATVEQNSFWPMYDALAARRDVLDREKLIAVAAELHLDSKAFAGALDAAAKLVDADEQEAARRGVQGAPVIFVNGQRVDGLQRELLYTKLADAELAQTSVAQNTQAPQTESAH